MNKENNKLICEFMKYEKDCLHHGSRLQIYYQIPDPIKKIPSGFWEDELLFYKSWDYLIPVVKKCIRIYENDPFNESAIEKLEISVSRLNIKEAYFSIIDFIKIYNNLKDGK